MAAQLVSLGKLVVPTPGTPVPLSSILANALPVGATLSPPSVHAFLIEVLATNGGKIYVGVVGLTKATLAGCLIVLAVPTANVLPTFSVSVTQAANALNLNQIVIDADSAGEGVLVSAIVC